MKKTLNNMKVKWVFIIGLLVVSFFSCQKQYDPNFTLPRQFKPGDIVITTTETKATLTWPASLFSPAATSYTLQVSKDSLFTGTNVYDKVVNTTTVVISDTVLQARQTYFARVKANTNGTTAESGWVVSSRFNISGEQIFLPLSVADIIDNAVLLKWRTTPALTRIVITPTTAGGTPTTINLTPADITAEKKIISGLSASTSYSAEIFDAVKSKGYLIFT